MRVVRCVVATPGLHDQWVASGHCPVTHHANGWWCSLDANHECNEHMSQSGEPIWWMNPKPKES